MTGQRRADSAPVVQAWAETLPFAKYSFDAALAISTVHHWTDLAAGLREMSRVARRRVVYFSEPVRRGSHWLTDDYLPEVDHEPAFYPEFSLRMRDGLRLTLEPRVPSPRGARA